MIAGVGRGDLFERVGDGGKFFGGDAVAVIVDFEGDVVILFAALDADFPIFLGEFYCV